MPASTKMRKRAAEVTARFQDLTAEVTRSREALEAAIETGDSGAIMRTQTTLATHEAARASLEPIVERLNRELATTEAEEAREMTLRRMADRANEATAGIERLGVLVPEIHAALLGWVQKLVAEIQQQRGLRAAFIADAQALGAPLHMDRPQDVSARVALLDELGRRGVDLAAVLSNWCGPSTGLDHPPALPDIEPLGRLIYDAARVLEYHQLMGARRAEDEAAVTLG